MPLPLAALIPAGVSLLGGILGGIGKHKERKETQNEAMRLEQENVRRAQGKAKLMRGVLNSYGYGHLIDDDALLAILTKTAPRPNTKGALFGEIGSGLTGLGKNIALAQANQGAAEDESKSSSFWDQLAGMMQQNPNTGAGGGASSIGSGYRP